MTLVFLAAVFAAGTLATFTDWLFMGVLFHSRYNRYPEVWRPGLRQGDRMAILYSCALCYVTAAAVIGLCAATRAQGMAETLALAALAWAAGPLVCVVTDGIWMKIDPRVSMAHALGYLARFALAGVAAGVVLA